MATPSEVQSAGRAAGAGNVVFTLTSSPAPGNFLIAFIGCNTTDTMTPPAGWTPVFHGTNTNNDSLYCWGRLVQAGDGATWTWTSNSSADSGQMYEIAGADTAAPVNGSATAGDGLSSTSRTSPGVVPTVLNCLPVAAETTDGGNAIASVTSGWTVLADTGNFLGSASAYGPATASTITAVSCTFNYTGGSSPGVTATLIIQPPQGVPSVEAPVPPRIPHPLWHQLLEVAQSRADWQAQGVASLAQQRWRLMDGANGRPGDGSTGTRPPGTATGSGTNVNGTLFYVTQSSMWLEGYWWYVAPAGGQSTSPQQFCLWSYEQAAGGGGGMVVAGSAVTSGTLSTGWNWVPLAQPVQLALYGIYGAATGLTGTYPQTSGQFNGGGPYQSGIVSGPLTAFSDNSTGLNAAPYGYGNGTTTSAASTDPALTQPGSDGNQGINFWLDVQVTNTAPAGYSGSYRLWPNMKDGYGTAADAAVNYVIGTEIILAQPCVINAVWYYRPGAGNTTQFATSADIWRVRDGVRVATQPAPNWRTWGGGAAPSSLPNDGQWVYTQFPGTITLPAGDYYVTIYNGNGSPDQWSSKVLGYWQAYNQAPDGTYQHMPPGANGITTGPLYAPTTPAASSIADFSNPATSAAGQSVFASGPPNQFPNRYVGTPVPLFQNYWVDIEVIPAATYQPAQPLLPQRIPHPLFTRLLEVAAYRTDGASPPPATTASPVAGLAAGTGAAQSPVAAVGVNAVLATGTAAAQSPVAAVAVNAGLASGTGAAQGPVPAIGINAGLASGTGTAQGPVPAVAVNAVLASAAATALNATASTSASGTANAVLATGTGTAQSAVAAIGVNAAVATGAGAALNATVQTSGSANVTAGLATGAGAAQNPAPAIAVNAAAATGAGTAQGIGRAATAGLATGAGTAQAPAAVLAAQAQAQAAHALAAALNATAAAVEPFTTGRLTASDAPLATLTASDTRTGGPG